MQQAIKIIGAACLALFITETSGIVDWIKWKLNIQRLKPFDCTVCLGFWVGLASYYVNIPAVFYAAIASALALILEKIIKNL
jgi:hypothetical protein